MALGEQSLANKKARDYLGITVSVEKFLKKKNTKNSKI